MRRFSLFGFLAWSLITTACSKQPAPNPATNSGSEMVKTIVVQQQVVADELTIAAKVSPDPAKLVHIFPPASGRLLRVEVRPGDRVAKGQTIAVLESSDVAQARSDYEKASTEVDRTTKAYNRAKLLLDHGAFSQREYQQAESDWIEAKSELARAAERLRVLGVPLHGSSNEVALTAPGSGSVLDLAAAAGELSKSTDNANPICTIADLSNVWVIGDLFEKDLAAVHAGEPVEISFSAYPGETWTGKLSVISDAIDPQTRTVKVRVVLPNPDRKLKPEMFGTIRVRRPESKAIVVPASAVLREGGDSAVMVQTKPGSYERRLVTIRHADANQAVIGSGLNAGEIVVVQGAALVRSEGGES